MDRLADSVGALDVLVDLAAEYESAKTRRGLVEYSDQVALALEVVRAVPAVGDAERARFKVVLLDEYQDTSVVQSWLLAELFGGLGRHGGRRPEPVDLRLAWRERGQPRRVPELQFGAVGSRTRCR